MQNYMDMIIEELSDYEIELFYDRTNMELYGKKVNQNYELITNLIKELYGEKARERMYIRMHGYKNWIIIRIVGEWNLSEVKIADIQKKCLEINKETIITFSRNDKNFSIIVTC